METSWERSPSNEKDYWTWERLDTELKKLATFINTLKVQEKYIGITGIPRGGTLLAVMLSHLTNLPYYDYNNKAFRFNNVVVVDDVVDTGHTYNKVRSGWDRYPEVQHIAENTTFAFLVKKPWFEVPEGHKVLYGIETDAWIVFPWERD